MAETKYYGNIEFSYFEAVKYFKRKWPGRGEMADDFASFCATKWLTKKYLSSKFYFIAVEFFREYEKAREVVTTNRIGAGGDVMKKGLLIKALTEKDEPFHLNSAFELFETGMVMRQKCFTQIQRAVLILYVEWELTLKEIGDVLSFSEANACLILKSCITTYRDFISKNKQ